MSSLSRQQKKSDDSCDGSVSRAAAASITSPPVGDPSTRTPAPPLSRRRRVPMSNGNMLFTPPPNNNIMQPPLETPTMMVVSPDSIVNSSSHSSSRLLSRKSSGSRQRLVLSLDRATPAESSSSSSPASTTTLSSSSSSSTRSSRSPSTSPIQGKLKGRRLFWSSYTATTRRRITILLLALIVASTCVTMSMTFFLVGELDQDTQHRFSTKGGGLRPKTPASQKQQHKPRVVYYESQQNTKPTFITEPRLLEDDPTLHAPPGEEAAPQDEYQANPQDDGSDCVYISEWQTASYPTCNLLHEVDLKSAGPDVLAAAANQDDNVVVPFEDTLKILGSGWFRHTWELDSLQESTVLKTLRLERDFLGEFYDLHRRDAVAMERLTHSPFVMDIYAFCGQSAINELADFGRQNNNNKVDLTNLEKFDRQLRHRDDNPDVVYLKLQLAASLAMGVAHVHEIDGIGTRPSMVHYDLNPRNIAMVKGGKPKLNDFNIAEFLRINTKTNETCGFPSRLHEPWWRAPEEVILPPEGQEGALLDEKVDVYALGNLLFHVLTTHAPQGKMDKKKRMDSVRASVAKGEPPALYEFYAKSKDPAIVAMRTAMMKCFQLDPQKRATAREVAVMLVEALNDARDRQAEKHEQHQHHRKKH